MTSVSDIDESVDVLVIGGGPAGLSLATEASKNLGASVLVAERATYFGGTPQSTHHQGFGVRDLHRIVDGPSYARQLERRAIVNGVDLRSGTNVSGWSPQLVANLSGHGRNYSVQTRALFLATGVYERSRHSRLVAGDRGAGIYTTGSLQRLVYQLGLKIGTRAVIVGAEHVSFSAVQTLAESGCDTVALITNHENHQTFAPLRWLVASRRHVPIITNDAINFIHGKHRVTGVTLNSGKYLACDTVIFSGDWMPENSLARIHELEICDVSRAPAVDIFGRTRQPGVFAIGNLSHPAEAADLCAVHARRSEIGLRSWLEAGFWPHDVVSVRASAPIISTWPSLISSQHTTGKMLLRVDRFVNPPATITVKQGDRTIWSYNHRRTIVTNRSITIPMHWAREINPDQGDVEVNVIGG